MGACDLHASPFVLTWNLYAGVTGLQGTDSGPRAHHGRGSEPTGGANISFPALLFWNFESWYCEAGVQFYQWTCGDL
jgi:hypothetical protein